MIRKRRLLELLVFCFIFIGLVQTLLFLVSNEGTYKYPMGLGSIAEKPSGAQTDNTVKALKNIDIVWSEGTGVPDGIALAKKVRDLCNKEDQINRTQINNNTVILHAFAQGFAYCPVEKAGTTFWRRVIYMLHSTKHFKHPYEVKIEQALGNVHRITDFSQLKSETLRFLITRDPYDRLLSAYIDKLVAPNPYFWDRFGKPAIKLHATLTNTALSLKRASQGHDITFSEFVYFVVNSERTGSNFDAHIASISSLCSTCGIDYNYIGRMNTFKTDALYVLKKLHQNTSVAYLQDNMEIMMTEDAIVDSIKGPFSVKGPIMRRISWTKALKRIWLKLQMRGFISEKIPLQLTDEKSRSMQWPNFVEMAKKANVASSREELKLQKESVKRQAFASVPLEYLHAFRSAFKKDFDLFGFDDTPSYIYNRDSQGQTETSLFNFSHLN